MLLTDRTLLTPNWTLAQAVAPAVTGGVNLVLFRETDLPPGPRAAVCRFVRDGIRGRAPLICAGDPKFAIDADADGVHLESESDSLESARESVGSRRLVGVTTLTPGAAVRAESAGADYAFVAYDWSEGPHPQPVSQCEERGVSNPESCLAHLRRIVSASALPVVVGMDMPVELSIACIEAGAAGVAICRPAMAAYDRTQAIRRYADALEVLPAN